MNPFDALAIEFGALTNLAPLLRVRNSAIYAWKARGRIPIKHLKKLEELSQGRLKAEMLRPDLFGEKNVN